MWTGQEKSFNLNKYIMKRITLLLLGVLFFWQGFSNPVLQNVYARPTVTLNGTWNYIVDPFDTGYFDYRRQPLKDGFFLNRKAEAPGDRYEYDFDRSATMTIPGDWNTQDDRLFFYEGTIWFKKDFTYAARPGKRVFLYFGAVNYICNVWVNGQEAGSHEGGFTPFSFDVTELLQEGDNFVIVRVNNERNPENVPTLNFDWWNYGGITRDVMLVETPEVFIDDYLVQLPKGMTDVVEGYIRLNSPTAGVPVGLQIPELGIDRQFVTDEQGEVHFRTGARPELWSPASPRLYDVTVSGPEETICDRIGFRNISTEGKSILLNGQPIFLKGISIHEEAPFRQGRVISREEATILLGWAKELGCNFVRLAHYPHNEHTIRVAEEMGLMVWSEIPVYWTIRFDNPPTLQNASAQLREMMERDKNRCAVVVWSVANETPHSPARDAFLQNLAEQVRQRDDTRLLSMAMEVSGFSDNTNKVEDYMSRYVDIISFNHYLGWYGGTPQDCKTRQWYIPYDKPFFVSEFGAGALQGYHGDPGQRWTEEYQAELYKNTLEMFDRVDGFAGTSPWILMDFRSPRRPLAYIQDFFNRKGLVSEKGIKKAAFYVLKDFYNTK